MPFDGVVTKCVVSELSELLSGGRIEKIFQPEADEIIMNIRSKGQNFKLLLSASANNPRIHITNEARENPINPPVFCMILRKHLSGGKVIDVQFMDYERIVTLRIESMNELGDLSEKKLIIEIMGRHSNIILTNNEDKIIDAIKHVDAEISRVREVMPARPYMLPPAQDKTSPDKLDIRKFIDAAIDAAGISIEKYLLNGIKGFSPLLCAEICHRASIDGNMPANCMTDDMADGLKSVLVQLFENISRGIFSPCTIYSEAEEGIPADFHCIEITHRGKSRYLSSISQVLDDFYSSRDKAERLRQKKADIVRALNNCIDRVNKKIAIQNETLREVGGREKLKLFGELITANIYCIPDNAEKVSLLNYYSENGDYVDVPLDKNLTPQQNAQKYFKQYAKAKSTYAYTIRQLEENIRELDYLESVSHMLENCSTLQEIDEIRQELAEQGYLSIKKKSAQKKQDKQLKPLHFRSSDGIDIFVGRNNKQNDYLTLKLASSNNLWLHTKNFPGSHVIIKRGSQHVPDSTLLEAAILAAYHSKAKMSSTVPVDFTEIKNVKKPAGAKPGMVIYENYKTIYVTPDEGLVEKLKAH